MKKLVFLIVIVSCMSFVYAEHNPTVTSETVTLSSKVITPFLIWDATPNGNPELPDVIKGQVREMNHFRLQLFEMQKESGYTVRLQLRCPEPVDGVDLEAHWYFNDTPPDWEGDFTGVQLNSDWNWYDEQTKGWISICVNKIDATQATSKGVRTFTASAKGWYINI